MAESIKISPNLLHIAEPYPAILLDAYGVFWNGNEEGLIPGSKEIMEKLVSDKKVVGILSNTTQLSINEIQKLASHGIIEGVHFHFYVTSGDVAKRIFCDERLPFETPKKKYYLFGRPDHALFQESAFMQTSVLDEADFVYLSVPHIDNANEEVEKIRLANLPVVCANPENFIEKMGKVFNVGKPYAEGFSLAMSHFHQRGIKNPAQVLMVGDTPETDIRGARNFGMASALITTDENRSLLSLDYPDYFLASF